METKNDDPIEEDISSQPYYLETITASEVKSLSHALVTPEEAPCPPLLLPSLLKSRPPERQFLPPPKEALLDLILALTQIKDRAIDELFSLKKAAVANPIFPAHPVRPIHRCHLADQSSQLW